MIFKCINFVNDNTKKEQALKFFKFIEPEPTSIKSDIKSDIVIKTEPDARIPVLDLKPVDGSANYTELITPKSVEPIPLDTGKIIPTSMPNIRRFEDTLIISDDKKAYLSNYFDFGPGRIFDQEHGLTLKNAYEILCLRLQTEKSVYDAFAKFINSFNPSADPAKKISAHGIEPYEFVIFMYKDNEHEYIIKVYTGKDIDFKKDNNGVVVGANNAIQFIIK